jgi:hypothetical protein
MARFRLDRATMRGSARNPRTISSFNPLSRRITIEQRMPLRHPCLTAQIAEQALGPNIVAAHRLIPHLVAHAT